MLYSLVTFRPLYTFSVLDLLFSKLTVASRDHNCCNLWVIFSGILPKQRPVIIRAVANRVWNVCSPASVWHLHQNNYRIRITEYLACKFILLASLSRKLSYQSTKRFRFEICNILFTYTWIKSRLNVLIRIWA